MTYSNKTKSFTSFEEFSNFHLPLIEQSLESYIYTVSDSRNCLVEAIKHSLLDAGKRIRPLLIIATHYLFENIPTKILPLASAVEMIHTYSLIHDDLPSMDNDDMRQESPLLM